MYFSAFLDFRTERYCTKVTQNYIYKLRTEHMRSIIYNVLGMLVNFDLNDSAIHNYIVVITITIYNSPETGVLSKMSRKKKKPVVAFYSDPVWRSDKKHLQTIFSYKPFFGICDPLQSGPPLLYSFNNGTFVLPLIDRHCT